MENVLKSLAELLKAIEECNEDEETKETLKREVLQLFLKWYQ